eukprot:1157635-Pelagomonas_calceolata.AAC.6
MALQLHIFSRHGIAVSQHCSFTSSHITALEDHSIPLHHGESFLLTKTLGSLHTQVGTHDALLTRNMSWQPTWMGWLRQWQPVHTP